MADHSNDPTGRRPAGITDTGRATTTRAAGTSEPLRTGTVHTNAPLGTTTAPVRRGGSGAGIAMLVLSVFLVVAVLFAVVDVDTFGGGTADSDQTEEGAIVSGATSETATGAGEPPVVLDTGAAGLEDGAADPGAAPAATDGAAAPAATDGAAAPAPAATE